jgi:hypothetical protein
MVLFTGLWVDFGMGTAGGWWQAAASWWISAASNGAAKRLMSADVG